MFNLSGFLRPHSVISSFTRSTARYKPRHNKKFIYKKEDRRIVADTISYYPRFKNEPEPDFPASKLFRVYRIKPMKDKPHWERRILRDFGLYENGSVAIVKNIPENNQRLWKVKHLVRIEPIIFPQGEPTDNDINHTFLKENGECLVIKEINPAFEKRVEAAEKFKKDPKQLTGEVLEKDTRLKWLNYW